LLPFPSAAALLVASLASAAGDTVKLSGPMAQTQLGDVTDFRLTSDGARIVYRADEDDDEVYELYAAPSDGSSAPLRLSHTLLPGEDVHSFLLGPDDSVVYAIERVGVPYRAGLFSVPSDGSAPPTFLAGPSVREFQVAAGGAFVVFQDEAYRLLSVPSDGSTAAVQLDASAFDFCVHPSSAFAVFSDGISEVFSVPVDGSTPAVPQGSYVMLDTVRPSSDGAHAYVSEAITDYKWESSEGAVYRITLDGSEPIEQLMHTSSGPFDIRSFELAALEETQAHDRVVFALDGGPLTCFHFGEGASYLSFLWANAIRLVENETKAVFSTEFGGSRSLHVVPIDGSQNTTLLVDSLDERWEIAGSDVVFVRPVYFSPDPLFQGLYGLPIDGGQPWLLNGPPSAGEGVLGSFLVHPDGQRVVYRNGDANREALFLVRADGTEPSLQRTPLLTNGRHVEDLQLTADGERIVYRADQHTDELFELFSLDMDGNGGPVTVNGPLAQVPGGGDLRSFVPEFDERSVVYTADQDEDEVVDLYVVSVDGESPPVNLTAPLPGAGDVTGFAVGAHSNHVAFGYDLPGAALHSRLYGARTSPVAGQLLDSSAEEILAPFALTPDATHVLYRKGPALDDCDLFTCPMDGSSAPERLGDFLKVLEFELAPGGDTVVFVAHAENPDQARHWIYAAPADGSGAPIQLNAPAPNYSTVSRFEFSPDGRAVFLADQETRNVNELFSVPIDGSGSPSKLNDTLVADGQVLDFSVATGAPLVVYRADQESVGVPELFAVPAAGSSIPLRLTPGRYVEDDHVLSSDGAFVFYRSRTIGGDVTELHVVRTDGSWSKPVNLGGTLVPGGDVVAFQVAPNGSQVVFLADKRTDEQFELFRCALQGAAVPLDEPQAFADVTAFRLDARSQRVLYLADRLLDGRDELFTVPLDGSGPVGVVNGSLVAGGDVRADFVPLVDGGVLYVADQELDETLELFRSTDDAAHEPPHLPEKEPVGTRNVVR